MKTKSFIKCSVVVTLCVGIFSCSSYDMGDEINGLQSEKELIPVSFKVDFSKEITPFRSDETMSLDDFFYYVYSTETGDLYKSLVFHNFNGAINDSLPEGDYTMVFMGANQEANLYWGTGPSWGNIKIADYSSPYFAISADYSNPVINRNNDVFYKKINCRIEKNNSSDNSIALDRIVGKIEIVLQDVIPSEVNTIVIESGFPGVFFYPIEADFTRDRSIREELNIIDADKVASGYTMFFVAFENINYDQSRYPLSIKLTAHRNIPEGVVDTGQSIVASKVIENVDILKNKTIRYSGTLFDNIMPPPPNNPSSSFSITGDDEWGEVIDKSF